jgi:hypothetical protein
LERVYLWRQRRELSWQQALILILMGVGTCAAAEISSIRPKRQPQAAAVLAAAAPPQNNQPFRPPHSASDRARKHFGRAGHYAVMAARS